jgi:hypothetical protein
MDAVVVWVSSRQQDRVPGDPDVLGKGDLVRKVRVEEHCECANQKAGKEAASGAERTNTQTSWRSGIAADERTPAL